jgi:hypothetical protein
MSAQESGLERLCLFLSAYLADIETSLGLCFVEEFWTLLRLSPE